jgi:tRNA-splicing ligase RtcB
MDAKDIKIEQMGEHVWQVAASGRMRVPAIVYADAELLKHIVSDNALVQAVNVAHMPGIVRASYAMPDAHWGYGFPIGGVAAFDPEEGGVISPGGIGFDINCGVRMMRTTVTEAELRPRLDELVNQLFREVPCGVGAEHGIRKLSKPELRDVMVHGARWAVENRFGVEDDAVRTEAGGALDGADPDAVSKHACERGETQLGTLGSGNHFLEIDVVDEVFDTAAAEVFGVARGLIVVQIHCGSRGFGHQICTDYLQTMQRASQKYGIDLPDRQLACAPVKSEEGRRYFGAMAAAANFAWCNRQVIASLALKAFGHVLGAGRDSLGWRQVYDVCHNVARMEEHDVDGRKKVLCVHRKGATRAFPPGHPEVPEPYRAVGQPVLIPGDMGTASYLLVGTQRAMEQTWGSTCHGAGRLMSRNAAISKGRGRNIAKELAGKGIIVKARGRATLAEEMPDAYKDVDAVVRVMHNAGITRIVARLKPIGVIKG